jgi:hypothetical protein
VRVRALRVTAEPILLNWPRTGTLILRDSWCHASNLWTGSVQILEDPRSLSMQNSDRKPRPRTGIAMPGGPLRSRRTPLRRHISFDSNHIKWPTTIVHSTIIEPTKDRNTRLSAESDMAVLLISTRHSKVPVADFRALFPPTTLGPSAISQPSTPTRSSRPRPRWTLKSWHSKFLCNPFSAER